MFLETRLGAFSIVQAQPPDDGDGAIYHVSSRARADLDRLLQSTGFQREISESREEGWPYRFAASQRDLFDLMSTLAETIDYHRF